MSVSDIIALVTAVIFFITLAGGIIGVYVSLAQRLTRVETLFELLGKQAANILHSPHTPELDETLEKYINDALTEEDFKKLLILMDSLENDASKPKEERVLAAIIGVDCRKRLNMAIPPIHKNDI